MHLKKIAINGFKSFADKVELVIDQGITGIVGPNGSGKSNVIDSVRWVMGEQNAKTLRGEKGTDIIFAGSAVRKSLGMAEVSLIFDNADPGAFCPPEYQHEEEIALTRRIYADGQRDYLINGKTCRLKDLVYFFTATGLGGRSYSMIQQGQVDRILNAKPENVREILEEAAGTTVFKNRRNDAEKRLVTTAENLARVEDILREIDKQKRTLKAQADKARVYKDTAIELKQREVSLLAHNYNKHELERAKNQDKIDGLQGNDADYIKNMAELEQKLATLQEQLTETDPHLREMQEKITRVREDIARAENTIGNSETKVSDYTTRLETLSEQIQEEQSNLEIVEQQFNAALEEVEAANTESLNLEEQITVVQEEVDQVDEGAKVLRSKKEDFVDEVANIQRIIESNKIKKESIAGEIEGLGLERKNQQQRVEDLESDFGELRILLDAAQVRVSSERKGLDQDLLNKQTLQKDIEENRKQVKEYQQKLSTAKESFVGTKTRLQSLIEMQAQSSGSASAHAKLSEDSDSAETYIGPVSELIEFDQSKFDELSKPAQIAVEKWSERLLVKDLNSLNLFIKACRNHGIGDFPVAVLSEVKEESHASWAEEHDALSLADFIKIKKKNIGLEKLVNNLFYLSSLELDTQTMQSIPQGAVVFTSNGIYSSSDLGQVVVTQSDQNSGYYRLAEKIEQLQKQLKINEQEVVGFRTQVDELEAKIQEDSAKHQETDDLLQGQNKGVLAVMTEFESLRQQEEYKTDLLTSSRQQLDQFDIKEQNFKQEVIRLTDNSKSLETELVSAKEELEEIEGQLEEIEEQKSDIWKGHGDKKIELARKQTRAQALKEGYDQTKTQLERLQTALNKKFDEKDSLEAGIEQTKTARVQAETDIKKLLMDREAFEAEYSKKREANAGVLEEQRELDAGLRKIREKSTDLQKKMNDAQIRIERALSAIEGIVEQAQEKYQLDIAGYEFEPEENYAFDEESKAVAKLRQKLERVGPINMMAIEEFDALTERETFILKQREEILKSIALIQEAIHEIEVTSKEKFLVIFHTINEEFGKLFPVLFPTGEAYLRLTDAEDPLNTGVEIMCRLPGKKLQRLNLFSGGEKALTAIALIFALLKTKPTPFCFLDEVDAPLDEANVVRYNKVLTALAKRFQFIVITHNRRTMEILDTLYGVTMQEPGVSKVVGVDMSKDIPTHLQSAFKQKANPAATQPN